MCVCTKERKGVSAEVLLATPCTDSLGGESGGHRHEGGEGRSVCWCLFTISAKLQLKTEDDDGANHSGRAQLVFSSLSLAER